MREFINILAEGEVHNLVPDVGALFDIVGPEAKYHNDGYRVTGWMKKAPPPKPMPDDPSDFNAVIDHILDAGNREFEVGEDKTRLIWCTREEAEYVTGSGVSGTIQPLDRIKVTGRVNWSEEQIEQARRRALSHVGEILF